MHRRALVFGGIDAEYEVRVSAGKGTVEFKGIVAADFPERSHFQLSYPKEPPILEFILQGRSVQFYSPVALKQLSSTLDELMQKPSQLVAMAEAMSYIHGDLSDFSPYGMQVSTGLFVFSRKMGDIDVRALVAPETLTLRSLLYSSNDTVLFSIEYSKFITVNEGVLPLEISASSPEFNVRLSTGGFQLSGRHSPTAFSFQYIPGTVSAASLDDLLDDVTWHD
ncbi:MAG: hypothetical protein WC712_00010 [Candidatus Brocadiia bacterium]